MTHFRRAPAMAPSSGEDRCPGVLPEQMPDIRSTRQDSPRLLSTPVPTERAAKCSGMASCQLTARVGSRDIWIGPTHSQRLTEVGQWLDA